MFCTDCGTQLPDGAKLCLKCGRHQGAVTRPGPDRSILPLAPGVDLELVRVPAGEFLMGGAKDDSTARGDEKPQHTVHLDEYYIGKYPVTVAQFCAFTYAIGYESHAELTQSKDSHPVRGATWRDARVFCQWASEVTGRTVRLPTEAEWEKAARGKDGRLYPWGNEEPDDKRCNFDDRVGDTTPVGCYSPLGDSPYGCADMAGNIWEWTSSLYYPYPYVAEDGREDPRAGGGRVLRGGAFVDVWRSVRCACRSWYGPDHWLRLGGFRVVVCPSDL